MDKKIKDAVETYYLANMLKYKMTNSKTNSIADSIFGSCCMAIALYSEVYNNVNLGETIKDIIISETEKNLGYKLNLSTRKEEINELAKKSIAIEEEHHKLKQEMTSKNINNMFILSKFYSDNHTLRHKVKTDWINWKVNGIELEKISEHIYGTCILALIMYELGNFDVDINKVLEMLVLHEIDKIILRGEKNDINIKNEASKEILFCLTQSDKLTDRVYEFNANETKEAKFAYLIDILESNLQIIYYEQIGFNNINDQIGNPMINNEIIQNIIKNGAKTVAEVWYEFNFEKFNDEEIFQKVLKSAIKKN